MEQLPAASFGSYNWGAQVGLLNYETVKIHASQERRETSQPHLFLDRLPIAKGACFVSYTQEHELTCLSTTRVELLREIHHWANDPGSKPIFWLTGIAGTGKSTISRTVAQSFTDGGRLSASFFFKRGEADRGSLGKFFTTIAADLALREPATAPHIQDVLDTDCTIVTKNAREQFNKLFLQPLLKNSLEHGPVVIIIDALDECERDDDIKLIISLFSYANSELSRRLRIFLTSLPRLPPRLGFQAIQGTYQDFILHDMPEPATERDITAFLEYKLARIRNDFNVSVPLDRQLATTWPSHATVTALAKMAAPLFIFAATVCRFISDRRCGAPDAQLKEVLSFQANHRLQLGQLDTIYMSVLGRLINGVSPAQQDKVLERFRAIIGPIIILESPLSSSSLAEILNISKITIDGTLDMLRSVFSIPTSSTSPIRLFHASFRDFLVDSNKHTLNPFWINEKKTHADMAANCLLILGSLKQDLCCIGAPGTPRFNISTEKINCFLPPEVQYACVYWVYHIEKADLYIGDDTKAYDFLKRHFLHWIEGLAIIGRASESLDLIKILQSRLQPQNSTESLTLLDDASRFLHAYVSVIDVTPLQIYSSLLIFAPKSSRVRTLFEERVRWICVKPTVQDKWSRRIQTLEGHGNSVLSAAFSHDSTLVASASSDKTVRIWRSDTGECLQTLKGHGGWVLSVAFSHDSTLIGSASSDKTVRIWRSNTGECLHMLRGHDDSIWSVAFSHNSTLIASASYDKTVRIWRSNTGECLQILKGHGGWVLSVTFSHDSTLMASASLDDTVRIWRSDTGECLQTLNGHGDSVRSVAFSHNSALLASASDDETVRIWRSDTGKLLQTLEGHGDRVQYVTFSYDSTLVASASSDKIVRIWCSNTGKCLQALEGLGNPIGFVSFSYDSNLMVPALDGKTVRIWRSNIGECLQTVEGHSGSVQSVVFSHDSNLIASAAYDKAIRIWCSNTGKCLQRLEGHCGSVSSVAFSHDSTLVASASYDKTVRIWRCNTGKLLQTLKGHGDRVQCVAFSHDSTLIASASDDKTVRIWYSNTGECLQTLEGCGDLAWSVAFSHNSTLVASAAGDDIIRIWCSATGKCLQTLKGHDGGVLALTFLHDSTLMASASEDETLRIWRIDTGECMHIINLGIASEHLSFDQNTSCLHTDIGAIILGCIDDTSIAMPSYRTVTSDNLSGYGVSVDRCWITWNGDHMLWLPVQFRPVCSAVLGSTVVIGSNSGRVTIFGFSPAHITGCLVARRPLMEGSTS